MMPEKCPEGRFGIFADESFCPCPDGCGALSEKGIRKKSAIRNGFAGRSDADRKAGSFEF